MFSEGSYTLFGSDCVKGPSIGKHLQKTSHCLSQSIAGSDTIMAWQVLRAVPKGARLLLECAGAVVAAAPSKFKVCNHGQTVSCSVTMSCMSVVSVVWQKQVAILLPLHPPSLA